MLLIMTRNDPRREVWLKVELWWSPRWHWHNFRHARQLQSHFSNWSFSQQFWLFELYINTYPFLQRGLALIPDTEQVYLVVCEVKGKQVSRVLTLTSGPTEPEPPVPRSQDWTGTGTWHYHCHWCIIMSLLQYHHSTVFTTIFIKGITRLGVDRVKP